MVADILDTLDSENSKAEPEFTDHEIAEISDSVKEAASSTLYGESVFDHTAMSPLSPASAV